MPSNILNKIVAENYDGFKREIIALGNKHNIKFDEDIFNDTYIKCYETLKNREITEDGVKYYFWVAFLNNTRKKYRHSKYNPKLSDLNENIFSADEEENEDGEICKNENNDNNTALFDEENYNILSNNINNDDNVKSHDNKYNDNFFKLHDIIKNAIIDKFGIEKFNIWALHFIENKTYEELKTIGINDVNFHNLFRQINSYIKNTLPKKDNKFKKLINDTLGV